MVKHAMTMQPYLTTKCSVSRENQSYFPQIIKHGNEWLSRILDEIEGRERKIKNVGLFHGHHSF